MEREKTFEAVFVLASTFERVETAFYGVNYEEARKFADAAIADSCGDIISVVFECEL